MAEADILAIIEILKTATVMLDTVRNGGQITPNQWSGLRSQIQLAETRWRSAGEPSSEMIVG